MLHEIAHMEKTIDENEERLLMIMDEFDQQGSRRAISRNKRRGEKNAVKREEPHRGAYGAMRRETARLEGRSRKS